MKILNTLIDGVASIGWGIALAAVILLLLFQIIYAVYGATKRFSPLSWIIGGVLLILLSIQCSLLVGGIKLKSKCSDVAILIDGSIPQEGIVSRENVKDAISKAAKQMPFVSNIIDSNDIDNLNPEDSIGDAVMHKAYIYLNWYMVRRACWILGFCVVAGFGIMFFMVSKRSTKFDEDTDYSYMTDEMTYGE